MNVNSADEHMGDGCFDQFLKYSPVAQGYVTFDGQIQFVSDHFTELFGYASSDVPTIEKVYELFFPDENHRAKMKARWEQSVAVAIEGDGHVQAKEYDVTCADGVVVSVEVKGNVVGEGIFVSLIDVTARNQTLNEIAMVTERLQMAAEAGKVGIWDYDLLHDKLVWDDAMYSLYSVDREEFEGTFEGWSRSVHPDDLAVAKDELECAIRGEKDFDTEFRAIWPDGSIHVIRALAKIYYTEEGVAERAVGTNWDITDVRQTVSALRVSERKYRLLFENMTVGFALHEMVKGSAGTPCDYRFLEVNPAFTEMTGLGQNAIGKTVKELLPGTEPEWLDVYAKVVETGQPVSYKNYSRELGKYFDVWAFRTAPNSFATIVSDVSDRQRMEEEVADMARFPEENPNPIIRVNKDYSIQYANPAASLLLKDGTLAYNGIPVSWRFLIADALKNNHVRKHETKIKHQTFLLTFAPVVDSNFVNIYGMDVTREKAIEEQYRQTQKMEAIGQLAGGIAHDFNNILQTILGFSELMIPGLESDEVMKENALEIRKAARRAAELTKQLLSFSRKQDAEQRELSVNDAILDQAKMLRRVIGEDIDLVLDLDQDIKIIKSDIGQMQQVIMNLCLNARDAMPKGGRLVLHTENISMSAGAEASGPQTQAGDYVCLSVTDTGSGMSEEVLTHIFEPFFTTKEVGAGSGLGLAVVYGIAMHHGGWVAAESEEGTGSTFRVYFPVYDAEMVDSVEVEAEMPSVEKGKNEHILVVEDDDAVRDMSMRILKDAGYRVMGVRSADQAVESFKTSLGGFDMVFSDVILPDQDGLWLADTLRELRPDVPVLLCSGHADKRVQLDVIRERGYIFLGKPFSVLLLLRTIREVLDGKNIKADE